MNFISILFLLSCVGLGCAAFYYHSKGNKRLSLFLILLLGFLLRLFTASDLYLHCWDERYHALVAKNMMQEPWKPYLYKTALLPFDYTNWTSNHIWLHKQPLSLWLMAISMKLFGVNEYALRFPSILSSTMCIGFVYYIGAYFYNYKTAFLAAFFFAINGLVIEVCSGRVATDHPDTLFLFFVLLSILLTLKFIEQRNSILNLLVGIGLGAALLTKWLPALIVLPLYCMLLWGSKKFSLRQMVAYLSIVICTALIVFLPWQFYIHSKFPLEAAWESAYNSRHIFETLEGQGGAWYYYLNRIRIDYGELIYLPIIWLLYHFWKNQRDVKTLVLIVWIFIPLLVYSYAATKMNGYLLILSPALFMVTAAFFFVVQESLEHTNYQWVKKIVLILLIGLPIRYCLERVKPFQLKDRKPQWVVALKNWHSGENPKTVLLGYKAPIEAMFYTNAIAYEYIPTANVIIKLQQLGYKIFINEMSSLPKELRNIKELTFISLKYSEF